MIICQPVFVPLLSLTSTSEAPDGMAASSEEFWGASLKELGSKEPFSFENH